MMKKRIVRMICVFAMGLMVITAIPTDSYAAKKPTEQGKYPTRKGMILVTPQNANWLAKTISVYKYIYTGEPLGHAGIVYSKSKTVEALKTVTKAENNWKKLKHVKRIYGLDVKKTNNTQDAKMADWCVKQVGKKYNYNYADVKTRKKFYCSHLIWAAWKDNYNINMNTWRYGAMVSPLELAKSDKTNTIYIYSK